MTCFSPRHPHISKNPQLHYSVCLVLSEAWTCVCVCVCVCERDHVIMFLVNYVCDGCFHAGVQI